MELTDALKTLFMETAYALQGSARRLFMARTVTELGPGGQRSAERALGWTRGTLRKGTHELASGFTCRDAFSARGRKRAEEHLPHLLAAIQAIVASQSQADPQLRTTRLYTRLRAAEVRRQLIAHKGSTDHELPTVQTITAKLNTLGYFPQKVAKSRPQKKFHQPMRSSSKCTGSSRRPMLPRIRSASRSTPRPLAKSVRLPVGAKVGCWWRRLLTILPPTPP